MKFKIHRAGFVGWQGYVPMAEDMNLFIWSSGNKCTHEWIFPKLKLTNMLYIARQLKAQLKDYIENSPETSGGEK